MAVTTTHNDAGRQATIPTTPRTCAARRSPRASAALEYFDFALYGLSTALIFNVLFF
jgi:hypothetical protein